jgi:hypothetical protein
MSDCISQGRRRLLSGATAAIALLASSSPRIPASAATSLESSAMPCPPVPFSTVIDSWDHHWFLWLPHHPAYESVEVASRGPDHVGRVTVWVWFTERAGSKHQIHYRNDPQLAATIGGHYRPITYRISGDDGRPRSVEVRFDDIENMPVEIGVRFDPDRILTRQGAGLTDQSGHMSDHAFLVFHRDTNALASEGRALIGPSNYTFGREENRGAFPFRWAYSHGISIGLILYGTFTATFGAGGYVPAPESAGLFVLNRTWGGSVSLLSDQLGQLSEYVDRDANGGLLRIVFDPPLPACDHESKRQTSSFSISISAAADVVTGSVDANCADHVLTLDWHPRQPMWASQQPFRSEISKADDRSLSVRATPGPQASLRRQ